MMMMKCGSIILTFIILDILCMTEYVHAFQCRPINTVHRTKALIDQNWRLNIISRPSHHHHHRMHQSHLNVDHSIHNRNLRFIPSWITRSLRSTMSGVMSVMAIIFTFSRRAVAASRSGGVIIGKFYLLNVHSF